MKPFLNNKRILASKVSLNQTDNVISGDQEIVKVPIDIFRNTVDDLGIKEKCILRDKYETMADDR